MIHKHTLSLLLVCCALVAHGADKKVNFTRDIKPLLSNHCYACHGPDANQRKAELRFDVRESAVEGAIVPGKSAESPLIKRVMSSDPELKMPPVTSKKPALSPAEIDLLRRWIDEGAEFDVHWSYTDLKRPEAPADGDDWVVNNIDNFVAHGYKNNGYKASPDADRRTLVRRLYFDLLGLPPTPQQVDKFVNGQSIESLIDELLASENYGERMALYWLDLVRYADTNGIHSDNYREHDLYREWVINAFNQNKRFDEFTIEQLAGDLMPNATKSQRIASGYNRLNLTTQEGGSQPKEFIVKYAADRVRNASVVWMGSTLGCAQCHNHKFDPFTQKDFYSFAAFFADIQETPVGRQAPQKFASDQQEAQVAEIDKKLPELRKTLDTQTPELDAALSKWVVARREELQNSTSPWSIVVPEKLESTGKATLVAQDDQSILSTGENAAKDTYNLTLKTDLEKLTGLRLEVFKNDSFPAKGLARGNGNFVLTRFEVEVTPAGADKPQPVKIKTAVADFAQNSFPVTNAIDGKANTGWAVEGHLKPANHQAVFVFEKPVELKGDATVTIRMRHESQYPQHNIGQFRLALTSRPNPSLNKAGLPNNLVKIIQNENPNNAEKAVLAKHFRGICDELAATRKQLKDLEARRKSVVDAYRPLLVSMSVKPRMIRILDRGNWLDESGEIVQPAVPAFLGDLGIEGRATRMDLAKWFVQKDNPLVARVFVNRLWKLFFGNGLVTSLDDYGAQGTLPSHPELLDWMATEFIDSGWDIKHMVKLMVLSRTYRQSSLESADQRERDPANQWLSRQNRFRLDAEFVRDNALAISGLLVNKLGGLSVKPYQPPGYWAHLNFPKRKWAHDTNENQYRRGMYTYWCRTFPHPSLLAFDAQSREESCVQRPRSNTPLQALVLLNDPTYIESARVFAAKILQEGGDTETTRLEFAYRQAIGRKPNQREQKILTALVNKHVEQYKTDSAAATEALSVGLSKVPEGMDQVQLAAWTSVARVILNLHETITRN